MRQLIERVHHELGDVGKGEHGEATAYGTTSSAGKDTLTLNHTLVWAISWIGSSQCPFPVGGAGPRPSAPEVQPLCDRVAFVNATNCDYIFSVSYAHQ